jgi:hypothetical protein
MFIKLEIKSQTPKAYQLQNNGWIPKSILDSRGLKHPFYQVKDWWLSSTIEKFKDEDKNAELVLNGIVELSIKINQLPNDILEYWRQYWGNQQDFYMSDSTDRRYEIGEWEMGIYS